jgi:hypothetical protein
MNTLATNIPWVLIVGIPIIFGLVFWATRKELLKRNEEREIPFLLQECATKRGFEIAVEGFIWWRVPQAGDLYSTYRQWGEKKVAKRVQDEVRAWLMKEVGDMELADVKGQVAKIANSHKGLDLGDSEIPIHSQIRILIERVDMKDSDARALANKAVHSLRADGVKEALATLKVAGLSARQAASVLTTLQAVESSGGQIAALIARLSELVEVQSD